MSLFESFASVALFSTAVIMIAGALTAPKQLTVLPSQEILGRRDNRIHPPHRSIDRAPNPFTLGRPALLGGTAANTGAMEHRLTYGSLEQQKAGLLDMAPAPKPMSYPELGQHPHDASDTNTHRDKMISF
ncbi:MAG: hypothetical protein ACO32I_08135 [Candidatus Limnocylindrus sp.]